MPGWNDDLETRLLNHFTSKVSYTAPTTLYAALSLTTISDDGTTGLLEIDQGGYTRIATTNGTWNTASSTAPAQVTNMSAIVFPAATASWTTGSNVITHIGLSSSATKGTAVIWFAGLTSTKTCMTNEQLTFSAGNVALKLGDPTDTY